MLAAGIGARLEKGPDFPPKVLMQFGGKSLLQRHIDILGFLGVRELVLGVGYRAEMIEAEIDALGARGFVRTVMNPDFRLGPITTLWALREEIACGEPIVFMDGDVLYRSEEHTSELQSLMRISYAVFCLKKKKKQHPRAQ